MVGMLTAAQRDVIERVEQLTREKIAPRAAHYDAMAAHPVERVYRDLRTCTLMPPAVDRMLEVVGKSALGSAVRMFSFGTSASATNPTA